MRILITGGTGSLGHALVRYYLEETTHRVVVFSRDELKQSEMRVKFPDPRLEFFLGDVRDRGRLDRAMGGGFDVLIHAAALKRVDSVCHDPMEVVKTNIGGSAKVLESACGRVARVLLVSTDKACYPTNAYGVSKAMAEALFTQFNVYGHPQGTRSAVVRYGNVLGSRGSVIEVWRSCATLPITSSRMTRFLITMRQAVETIQYALDGMAGGEIVVPRLPACRLVDLAEAYRPGVPWVETGLRPGGEKLQETLLTKEEGTRAWDDGAYTVIPPDLHPWTNGWGDREPVGHARSSDLAEWLDVEGIRALLMEAELGGELGVPTV